MKELTKEQRDLIIRAVDFWFTKEFAGGHCTGIAENGIVTLAYDWALVEEEQTELEIHTVLDTNTMTIKERVNFKLVAESCEITPEEFYDAITDRNTTYDDFTYDAFKWIEKTYGGYTRT